MVANHHFTRMETLELKDLIFRKIGQQRAKKYFYQLRSLLSQQLSKIEFDNVCTRTIGRENIGLHNRLIKSIMMNACLAKVPPPIHRVDGALSIKVANSYQGSCLQSLHGNAFIQSPRKGRSPRERKFRDRPSPVVGPLGKSPSAPCEEGAVKIQEQQSATELLSLGSRPPVEVASVEEGEEVEQIAGSPPSIQSRSPVTAPYGVSIKAGGARKGLRVGNACADYIAPRTFQSCGMLPDSRSLGSVLEKRLGQEGIGISLDCANLLNNGLDVFLRRLIGPCIGIAGRHSSFQINPGSNGLLPAVYSQSQPAETCASMLDFRVAMESNPRILGEDWPLQLEKICAIEWDE